MMKNKGFTLVEVIMVVVILGIIIGIAVPSYIAISNNIKTKNYEQKIDNIKAKALEYASDYNVENITIPVKVLIEEGYLAEENPDGNDNEKIMNPLGGYLDCQNINITREDDTYKIEVIDSISCSTSGLVNTSKILVDVYEYHDNQVGNKLGTNGNVNWTNSDKVILMANVSNVSGVLNDSIWVHGTSTTNKSGKIAYSVNEINDPAEYANVIVVDALVFLDTEYTFSINTNNGYVSQKVSVKIDREIPTASASVSSAWTKNNTKDVQLSGSDGSGSGIDKFYVTTDTTKPDKNAFNRGYINDDNQDYTKAELDVGTYYVYAIDKAGNISNSYKIEVSGIDKTGPVCKYAVGKTNWTQTDFTITYGCQNDTGTGCKTLDKTETINYTAKTKTINWTIEDNIGNKTECSQLVNTFVDKTAPVCVSSGGSDTWTNASRTITGTCSDPDSGCVSNVSKDYTTQTEVYNQSAGTVYDKAGNSTVCPANQTVKIDKTAPSCSSSGGSSSWTNDSRTLVGTCSDSGGSGCAGNASWYINWEGEWYNLSPGKVKDNAGNETQCPSNQTVKVDKTAPTYNISVSGSSYNGGYQNSYTISVTCSDNRSGIASGNVYETKSGKGWNNTAGTCRDNAGNTTSYSRGYTVYKWEVCSTYQCNPHSCNCHQGSCNSWTQGGYWDWCSGPEGINPATGCACCTNCGWSGCGVYDGKGCGGWHETGSVCNGYNTECSTCYDTCESWCWR